MSQATSNPMQELRAFQARMTVGAVLEHKRERLAREAPPTFPPLTRELAQFDMFDAGIDVTEHLAA